MEKRKLIDVNSSKVQPGQIDWAVLFKDFLSLNDPIIVYVFSCKKDWAQDAPTRIYTNFL